MSAPPHAADPSDTPPPTGWLGLGVSLVFWLSLAASVGVFAGLLLAPKYAQLEELEGEWRRNQTTLLSLEHGVDQLHRLLTALEEDSDFRAELARVELDAVGPQEEVIPVEARYHWKLQATAPIAVDVRVERNPWQQWAVRRLSQSGSLRTILGGAAAGLALLAFTFCHDSLFQRRARDRGRKPGVFGRLRERYSRS